MGMAEEEEGKRGGGGWPCTRHQSPIFHVTNIPSIYGHMEEEEGKRRGGGWQEEEGKREEGAGHVFM